MCWGHILCLIVKALPPKHTIVVGWSHATSGVGKHSATGSSVHPEWPDLVMLRMLKYSPDSVCIHFYTTLFCSGVIYPRSIIYVFLATSSLLCMWLMALSTLFWFVYFGGLVLRYLFDLSDVWQYMHMGYLPLIIFDLWDSNIPRNCETWS